MNKTIAIASLLLIAGNTQAHNHPTVDALTHAVEHLTIDAQTWLPYLFGLSLAALIRVLLKIKHGRRIENRRRLK